MDGVTCARMGRWLGHAVPALVPRSPECRHPSDQGGLRIHAPHATSVSAARWRTRWWTKTVPEAGGGPSLTEASLGQGIPRAWRKSSSRVPHCVHERAAAA